MGCQSEVQLGRTLTWTVCTHDPDTGALTDADSAPLYRIYENTVGTAIMTGTMALLDDANTTGFYSERISVTTANGFEAYKSYNIYITAAVDGSQGGVGYGFVVDPASSSSSSSSSTAYELTARRGDTYKSASDNPVTGLGDISARTKLWFTVKMSTGLTDAQATLLIEETDGLTRLNGSGYGTAAHGSITVSDASNGDIAIEIDEAATDDLRPRSYPYDIQMLDSSGDVTTLRTGTFTVQSDVTRAIA